VFVHFSAIQSQGYRTLDEGAKVEFESDQGPQGAAGDQRRFDLNGIPSPCRPDAAGTRSDTKTWRFMSKEDCIEVTGTVLEKFSGRAIQRSART